MVSNYTNVGLPEDMIRQIDKVVCKTELGYKSRGEFVKESVRNSIKELMKMKLI